MRLSRKYLFFSLLIYCISLLHAQTPDTLWTKVYGGEMVDFSYSVYQTFDSGYVFAGTKDGNVYLAKLDKNGDAVWEKTYGGGTAYSSQQTTDSGFVITGTMSSSVYLLKTDKMGETIWTKTYESEHHQFSRSVQQTTDGGYIMTGFIASPLGAGALDVYLIKTDLNGDTMWTKTYGRAGNDNGNSVQQTSDGGYIIAGVTESSEKDVVNSDVYLVKTDSKGALIWEKFYGGPKEEGAFSVREVNDKGYVIVGHTSSYGLGNMDVYTIKTDANGDILWTKTYGWSLYDRGYALDETRDGGYIIVGRKAINLGLDKCAVYLIKTDSYGDTLWTGTYGGDSGWSVQQTSDGGYIAAGITYLFDKLNSDIYILKIEPDLE